MISSLNGEITEINAGSAVIDINGVGYFFLATPQTLSRLKIGAPAKILTSLIVREDSLTLFGFADSDEREIFRILLGVSGIGAKTALATLSTLTPDQLRQALYLKDEKTICKVPGIGPKAAKRIILEIGEKLGKPQNLALSSDEITEKAESSSVPDAQRVSHADVLAALMNLGWHERDAEEAIQAAYIQKPQGSVPELLRLALQILGSRR